MSFSFGTKSTNPHLSFDFSLKVFQKFLIVKISATSLKTFQASLSGHLWLVLPLQVYVVVDAVPCVSAPVLGSGLMKVTEGHWLPFPLRTPIKVPSAHDALSSVCVSEPWLSQ